jgi:hypothetical protein
MTISPIDQLIAEQACRNLVMLAARFNDSQDYDGFAGLFLPEGVMQRPGGAEWKGREAIAAAYKSRPSGRITRHLITNSVVSLESPSRARALSYVLLWSGDEAAELTPFGRPAHARQLVGEFDDIFEKLDGVWFIERREARFDLHLG